MSRMSEIHADLASIHQIILGQRKVATENMQLAASKKKSNPVSLYHLQWAQEERQQAIRVNCLTDLLLELEAAGVVWPDNVVILDELTGHRMSTNEFGEV